MLRTRFWTALVALPAVLALVLLAPDWFFSLAIAALGAIGLWEIASMSGARGPISLAALAVAGGAPLLAMLYSARGSLILAVSVIAAMLALVAEVAVEGGGSGGEGIPLTILGGFYVGVLFPYFALLRNRADGINLIILMFLLVVASDTGAYFAGSYLGRIKLARKVSPHKTVEGALAGLALCVGAGWVLRGLLVPEWSARRLTLAAVAIGVLAQLGDLACSAYKRTAGVKDSGWMFPGHGGLLDRTSSLVLAVVFTYYHTR